MIDPGASGRSWLRATGIGIVVAVATAIVMLRSPPRVRRLFPNRPCLLSRKPCYVDRFHCQWDCCSTLLT